MENKLMLVKLLQILLKEADNTIKDVTLQEDEEKSSSFVVVEFKAGGRVVINVTADSHLMLIFDVVNKLLNV